MPGCPRFLNMIAPAARSGFLPASLSPGIEGAQLRTERSARHLTIPFCAAMQMVVEV